MGYYELEKHENKEFELINMGILTEYRSKGFGSLLLNHVLKNLSKIRLVKFGFILVR